MKFINQTKRYVKIIMEQKDILKIIGGRNKIVCIEFNGKDLIVTKINK